MSLFDRLLGGSRSKAYAEGMALLEEGHFAEAADRLRVAALGRSDTPSGSLASYHYRQALLGEGRRLMRAGLYQEAAGPFGVAVRLWELYPDLHCLYGAALGFGGAWDEALSESRIALRVNADYIEARLLEALSLSRLERSRDCAASLNTLVESGRRVSHWLVDMLNRPDQYLPEELPENLDELLLRSLSGRSEKEEVAEAVAMCRGGNWGQGLQKFAALVEKRPRYPDYRTRLAAALFQVGRLDEALTEVEAALGLNESYPAAIDLKGLILADRGCLVEARDFLAAADAQVGDGQYTHAHEEMFAAYLRAVLALLTGDPEKVPTILEGWPDLIRTFARAELLLAASEDLRGRTKTCSRRLTDLAEEWSAETQYFHLLTCHHLENRRYREASSVLARWPATDHPDLRPGFLDACLAVFQGRVPDLPRRSADPDATDVPESAWLFLQARVAYLKGNDQECDRLCRDLIQRGHRTERVLRLLLAATVNLDNSGPVEEAVLPDSCLPGHVMLMFQSGQGPKLAAVLEALTAPHPENLWGNWLSPGFWLEPVRGWIS